jgi:hypothetical protein
MKKPPVSLVGSQAVDGHQELAAAVIHQAVLDAASPDAAAMVLGGWPGSRARREVSENRNGREWRLNPSPNGIHTVSGSSLAPGNTIKCLRVKRWRASVP